MPAQCRFTIQPKSVGWSKPGRFKVLVGSSSRYIRVTAEFEVL
jgi:hypothetical protein